MKNLTPAQKQHLKMFDKQMTKKQKMADEMTDRMMKIKEGSKKDIMMDKKIMKDKKMPGMSKGKMVTDMYGKKVKVKTIKK